MKVLVLEFAMYGGNDRCMVMVLPEFFVYDVTVANEEANDRTEFCF